jgi:hypothetical protein
VTVLANGQFLQRARANKLSLGMHDTV